MPDVRGPFGAARFDDGERLARMEELVQQLVKRADRQDDTNRAQFETADRVQAARIADLREALVKVVNGRLETLEERYKLVRIIVFAMCAGILVAFLNAAIGGWVGIHPIKMPQLPPYHSSEEIRERIAR